MKQIPFRASDTGPLRVQQLGEMCRELCQHEVRIDALEESVGTVAPSSSPAPADLTDPGDLTIYFDNGRA